MKLQPWMTSKAAEIKHFCQNTLASEKLSRNDYKEFLELVLVLLGSPPPNFTFKKPQGCSKARFMALAIYSIKLVLFDQVLKQSATEFLKLERFVVFVSMYYVKYWFNSPIAPNAPSSDLSLYKNMLDFQKYDPAIAKAVIEKFSLHTWYLNQEFVVLNLFSSHVSEDVKAVIVEKLLIVEPPEKYAIGAPEFPALPKTKKKGLEMCVSDSVGHGSLFMFDVLGFKKDWLKKPMHTWKTDESYLEMEEYVRTLLVCNDSAERGIKLVSEYVDCLTKNSKERQDLLQVVEAHTKQFSGCDKDTLSKDFHV